MNTSSIIYHYTSIAAIQGMIDKYTKDSPYLTMWATHSQFLNDPTEYEYGKIVGQKLLEEVEQKLNIAEADRLSFTMYDESMKQYFVQCERGISCYADSLYMATPFVISFSKNRDLLPMWTSYGKNGRGIAIGFNRESLEKHNNHFTVKDCYYDYDGSDYTPLKNKIKYWYEMMLQNINGASEGYARVCQIELIMTINAHVAAYIKHESYKYEQEVRCKVIKSSEIKFRESNGLIIPYTELRIPIDAIEEIIIGPTQDAERMKLAIEMLLKTNGIYRDIKIKKSKIPYRG